MKTTTAANKSMDVRAKQRLSYQRVYLPFACVFSVLPHVVSIVMLLFVNIEDFGKISFFFRYFSGFYSLLFSQLKEKREMFFFLRH